MTGDKRRMETVQLLELLSSEVSLLVEAKSIVYPGLQVQAVLHSPPVIHLTKSN